MKRILAYGVIIIVCLALVTLAGGYWYFIRLPLPVVAGEIQVQGLAAPVKVIRDRWGVPHIYAENRHDLFFAQGYVQAQDRLWQMDINRRMAAGRLSEILGPEALEVDKLSRTFGMMRAAERELASYTDEDRAVLTAFCQGVNAHMDSAADRPPIEFRLLGYTPEPWRPADSLAWAKFMALGGSKNWQEEIVRLFLVRKLGQERAAELLARDTPGEPIVASHFDMASDAGPLLALNPYVTLFGGASNNWVVHGSRTDTGAPILANDMHLPVGIPSVWYEIHLSGGGFDVIGLSLPGVPLVIAGHNQDVAWGVTFAYVDNQDVFFEKMGTEKRGQYLFRDEWLQAERIRESIRVKGQDDPVYHDVWVTRHGPLINKVLPGKRRLKGAAALKWSAHEPGNMLANTRRLNLARNWTEFKAAARDWCEPSMNLVYADRQGHIGYVLAGRIPVRAAGAAPGPFPGWTGQYEWTRYLPPSEKPFLIDPPQGFIATANNRIVGSKYPYYIAEDFFPDYRAERIEQVLAEKDGLTLSDCRELQGDLKCLPAEAFLAALAEMDIKDERARDLFERLLSWNRELSPDSVGGAIYSVLWYRLLENTFRDELGPVADQFFGHGLTLLHPFSLFAMKSRVVLLDILSEPDSPWFDDVKTPVRETLADVLEKSLIETADFLENELGKKPSDWQWGKLHRVEFSHPMGKLRLLAKLFNLGPYDGSGHFSTVLQSAVTPGMDFRLKGWTASNRHIYDLQDWDRSLGGIVPGQSGLLGSPHYSDQVDLWLDIGHHPLYYTRERVEAEADAVLTLRP